MTFNMTVKELISKLLEMPMDAEVFIYDPTRHEDEHGICNGYCFDIDEVKQNYDVVELRFTDWRNVTPRPKMGHWKLNTLKIRAFTTENETETYDYSVYCDNCGYTWDYTTDKKGSLVSNFCPNCGLKMESMEE